MDTARSMAGELQARTEFAIILSSSRFASHLKGAIMVKKAWAVWKGSIKEGGGTISTETGVLREAPYGFKARFENGKGTNPEELIGAAHAGCFSMAFSLMLGMAGLTPEKNRDPCRCHSRQGRRWLRDHREPPDRESENSWRERIAVSGDREQGQDRLPGVEAVEGQNHNGRQAGKLNAFSEGESRTLSPRGKVKGERLKVKVRDLILFPLSSFLFPLSPFTFSL